MKTNLVCSNCGKCFERYESQKTKGEKVYCSRECAFNGRAGETRPLAIKRYTKTCPVCKKEFECGGKNKRKTQVYCSNKCSSNAIKHLSANCAKLSIPDASYIAGFLDGEGTIGIYHRSDNGGNTLRVSLYQSQKGIAVLEWVKDLVGAGRIVIENRCNENWDTACQYSCNSEVAAGLLRQLLPYLKIKKRQADIAIEYAQKCSMAEFRYDKTLHKEYLEKMRVLNARGLEYKTMAKTVYEQA